MEDTETMSYVPESLPARLFRRCVVCPIITPSCPACKSSEVCVQFSLTCDTCPYRKCVSSTTAGTAILPAPHGLSTRSKGAMAGGVIAGVIVIAIITYLVWRFFIKKNRAVFMDDFEDELEETPVEKSGEGVAGRPMLHGRESATSTVFTRASNVIPIAFVPGVIDRSGAAPPVPPVPIPTTSSAQQATTTLISPYSDMHGDIHFMPDDLRESTYSGFTDDTSSVAARSTTTSSGVRGSVASTVYGADAADVNAVHVQTAQYARPAIVSVHSSLNRGTSPVPAVPRIDYSRYRDLASTSRGGGDTSTTASGTASPAKRLSSVLNSDTFTLNASLASGSVSPSTATQASRLDIPRSGPSIRGGPAPQLAAVIEEATRRASRQPMHGGLGSISMSRNESPFSDSHAIEEDDID